MRDGPIRRTLKAVAFYRYFLDLYTTRFILRLKGEPRYRLCGACGRCGACCETPMIHVMAPFFYLKSLRAIFLAWQKHVNGLELLEERRIERTFVFRCTHLEPETKQCDSYPSRPGMCRDYPRNILYYPNPEFLEECSFYAEANNADLIRESLEDLDLPPEKLEEIRRKFHASSKDD